MLLWNVFLHIAFLVVALGSTHTYFTYISIFIFSIFPQLKVKINNSYTHNNSYYHLFYYLQHLLTFVNFYRTIILIHNLELMFGTDMQNFHDISHYRMEVGDKMLAVMQGEEIDAALAAEGFGQYVTKENVEVYISTLQ